MDDSEPKVPSGDRLKGKLRKFPGGVMAAKEKFVELRAEGRSYDEITTEVGVSRQTLQCWSRELKIELENAKAYRLDSIKAKYRMTLVHRVEMYSQTLARLKIELEKRDLSEIATEKLAELFLKFARQAREEDTDLQVIDRVLPTEAEFDSHDEWTQKRAMI